MNLYLPPRPNLPYNKNRNKATLKFPFTREELTKMAKKESFFEEKRLGEFMRFGEMFLLGNLWAMMWVGGFGVNGISIGVIVGGWLIGGMAAISWGRKIDRLKKGDWKSLWP